MEGMFWWFWEGEVFIAEWVDDEHPFIKKLGDGLRIPPIFVEPSIFKLGYFSHCQHDIFHDEVVETPVLEED